MRKAFGKRLIDQPVTYQHLYLNYFIYIILIYIGNKIETS